MINSANTLEFLKTKILTMDKYSSTTNTKLLPPCSSSFDSLQEKFLLSNEIKTEDRVKVQHLENHTNLQNNKCCNTFRNLYDNSKSASSSDVKDKATFQMPQIKDEIEIDVVNVDHLNSTTQMPLNIQNESAFNIDFNNKYHINNIIAENNNINMNASIGNETKNNLKMFYCKEYNCYDLISKKSDAPTIFAMTGDPNSQRTEDQDNAYRHIESVHNYAKSKSFEGDDDYKTSPNGSRHSSFLSEDEEEDGDEDDDGAAEYDNDGNIDYEDRLADDLDADYEDIFNKRRYRSLQKLALHTKGAPLNVNKVVGNRGFPAALKKPPSFVNILRAHKGQQQQLKLHKNNYEDDEDPVDVDIESVEPNLSSITPVMMDTKSLLANNCIQDESAAGFVKPDHHARRPMNAFLIFCKRHRAIVKDRYKNLENRAITKILGDWWASLDSNEKKCFTNLAQQNKDAFFSANPNFKWYKLPAPPLRTLTTRPANIFGQELQEYNNTNGHDLISNIATYSHNHSNYFKLADEAHMGDLSQLMQDKSKTIKQSADLQQALGETSQFMSTHIVCKSEILDENYLKRRLYSENSFSSNSSEEDITEPKKKTTRTCKGKRYQELINSGQIATALKKTKSLIKPIGADAAANNIETNMKLNCSNPYNLSNLNSNNNNNCLKRSLSETENTITYDMNGFDLEEKIKELPALDLDDYLQRKRNTKKKKKFSSNGKKRGPRSGINNKTNQTATTFSQNQQTDLSEDQQLQRYKQQSSTAVGSQKRKARKESITRRDITAIEQEVASLLPLTINGCCYLQDAPTAVQIKEIYKDDIKPFNITSQSPFLTPTSPIIPKQENSSSPVSFYICNNATNMGNSNISNDNISPSTTSDLLILAEVAASQSH